MTDHERRGTPRAVLSPEHRQRKARAHGQRRASCHRSEGGIATVWGLSWVLVCLSVGWTCLLAAAVVASQHHLDAAADLASLAGAARSQLGGDGCAAAQQVTDGNGVLLLTCEIEGGDVVVTVNDTIALPFGLDGRLFSAARAGPAEVTTGRL